MDFYRKSGVMVTRFECDNSRACRPQATFYNSVKGASYSQRLCVRISNQAPINIEARPGMEKSFRNQGPTSSPVSIAPVTKNAAPLMARKVMGI